MLFAGRADASGRFPVSDGDGAVVAEVERDRLKDQFRAFGSDGELLCSGGRVTGQPLQARDASDELIVEIKVRLLHRPTVSLPTMGLHGALVRHQQKSWEIVDERGDNLVLAKRVDDSALHLHPSWEAYANDDFSLPLTVGLVQLVLTLSQSDQDARAQNG